MSYLEKAGQLLSAGTEFANITAALEGILRRMDNAEMRNEVVGFREGA